MTSFNRSSPVSRAISSEEIRTARPPNGTLRIEPSLIRRRTVRSSTRSQAATSPIVKREGAVGSSLVNCGLVGRGVGVIRVFLMIGGSCALFLDRYRLSERCCGQKTNLCQGRLRCGCYGMAGRREGGRGHGPFLDCWRVNVCLPGDGPALNAFVPPPALRPCLGARTQRPREQPDVREPAPDR